MKRRIHTRKTHRIDSSRVLPAGRLHPYTLLFIGLVALLSTTPALGQITITLADELPLFLIDSRHDLQSFLSEDTALGGQDHPALQVLADQSGANQNWDLTAFTYGGALPFSFFIRAFDASKPGGNVAAYQGANCVGESVEGDSWSYFFIGDNQLEQFGNLLVGGPRVEHAPPALDRLYPVQFGSSWARSFTRTIVGGPGGSISVDESYTVDGWGTLSVPGSAPVSALRMTKTTQIGGVPIPEPEILFVTKDGISARIGFDIGFQVWESVEYTIETVTGGGPEVCRTDPEQSGVLFIVDDAANLSNADGLARDLMMSLNLVVEIMSDEAVTTEDGDGRDLIVISGSSDASVIAANFSATEVPLVSWEAGTFDDLLLTGTAQGTDYGVTADTDRLTIEDSTHPIANGGTGTIVVSNSAFGMNYGVPSGSARIVATADGGKAVIFTYNTDATLVGGGGVPARRVGFYMDAAGLDRATTDGEILLENALLWALGRDAEISSTVAIEARDGAVPDAFHLDQNYPNPFNPTTAIPFSVAAAGPVSLAVYNVLGQEVAVLVDEPLAAGNYTADFRADGLPSGVYLYRLKAGSTVVTRKMLLAK